jgi:hypothetical protein
MAVSGMGGISSAAAAPFMLRPGPVGKLRVASRRPAASGERLAASEGEGELVGVSRKARAAGRGTLTPS